MRLIMRRCDGMNKNIINFVNNIILQLSEIISSFQMSSLYIRALKTVIQIFFLLQSLVLIIPASLYRLTTRLLTNKKLYFNPLRHTHEDVFKSDFELLKLKGFKIVQHECETEDNAFVSFWRIMPEHQKPVLIQHGLLDCSMSWFLHQNIEKCLPYILAKAGYDVWIGNNRGTKFSCKNTHLAGYWQYSVDHLIQYDIPCMFDYILTQTQQPKIIYIGHSQGTTQLLSAIDVHPSLGQKIQTFVGLGPVISLKHLQNHILLKIMDKLKICELLKIVGFQTMLIIPNWMSKLIGVLIYNSWFYFKLFLLIVKGLCGSNQEREKINLDRFGVIISHQPGGTSINNVLHWVQIYRRGQLHKFDHGKRANVKIYGQPTPPVYTYNRLKEQSFNVHLFRGTADKIITDHDFNNLVSKIRVQKCTVHEVKDYAHLDYIWCEDAYKDIYHNLIQALQQNKCEQYD